MNSENLNKGFNPTRDMECRKHNQILVDRAKEELENAKNFNTGKLETISDDDIAIQGLYYLNQFPNIF